jgi:hypothetical protein
MKLLLVISDYYRMLHSTGGNTLLFAAVENPEGGHFL